MAAESFKLLCTTFLAGIRALRDHCDCDPAKFIAKQDITGRMGLWYREIDTSDLMMLRDESSVKKLLREEAEALARR
jgi:hypothetical protein